MYHVTRIYFYELMNYVRKHYLLPICSQIPFYNLITPPPPMSIDITENT